MKKPDKILMPIWTMTHRPDEFDYMIDDMKEQGLILEGLN